MSVLGGCVLSCNCVIPCYSVRMSFVEPNFNDELLRAEEHLWLQSVLTAYNKLAAHPYVGPLGWSKLTPLLFLRPWYEVEVTVSGGLLLIPSLHEAITYLLSEREEDVVQGLLCIEMYKLSMEAK